MDDSEINLLLTKMDMRKIDNENCISYKTNNRYTLRNSVGATIQKKLYLHTVVQSF